jgi:flavodoxin/ferredoxin
MKSVIVYYSQTGNTKKIAKSIQAGIIKAGATCDLLRLKDVDPQKDLAKYDLIGLGSPVIHAGETPNVKVFLNYLKQVEGKHGFSFSTHGTIPGYYFGRVVPALQHRGLTVIGWKDWFCAAYHPLVPKPYFTDGHPDEIDLKEAEDFGKELVERSRRISKGEIGLIPTLETGKDYDARYFPIDESPANFRKMVLRTKFNINMKKCKYPKCTFCMDICPTNAIDLSVSPPEFDGGCDYCWLCEQACPNGAIEVDYKPLDDFHKPFNYTVLKSSINYFEKKGLFRPLVPEKDIGYDTSGWTYKKPRIKVDY